MKKATVTTCFWALAFLQSSAAFAQSEAALQTTDAVQRTEDSRIAQLTNQDPATLVSEGTYSLQWPALNEKNIGWRTRVWRTVDTRVDLNAQLTDIGTGHLNLTAILIKGVLDGKYKAYTHSDDVFSKGLSTDAFRTQLSNDTTKAGTAFNPALVTKFRVKEDWIYVISEKKLVCRIIAIAPVRDVVTANGDVKEQLMFWLYYPTIREYFVTQKLNAPAGSVPANLDELFELHQYSGTVDKTVKYARFVEDPARKW
jgi:hypothetical protein